MPTTTTPHPTLKKYYDRDEDRQSFVTALFDRAAKRYDRVCALMSLGSGRFYRRSTLRAAGLRPGMTLLDVATGTGLVAREATAIVQDPTAVVGLDPSAGMLAEARKAAGVALVQGQAESLPFRDERFDFLTIGYALRHVADLGVTFRECRRVLKPGGRLLVLEISRPRSAMVRWLLRVQLERVVPLAATTWGAPKWPPIPPHARNRPGAAGAVLDSVRTLTRYYWDTIAECVPVETILDALRASGFGDVGCRVRGGLLTEYLAVKPGHAGDERLMRSARPAARRG